jgi:hypothetical protein
MTWDKREILRGGKSANRTPYASIDSLSFLAPEGEGKPALGGELRREEHRLPRTRVSVDRVVTVDNRSEGFFRLPFPPISGTNGVVQEQKIMQAPLDQRKPTSLADQRPRSGSSRPHNMETSDILF